MCIYIVCEYIYIYKYILYIYTYLSGSAFLANLIPPNKQSFKVKSEFTSRDDICNS